MRLLLTAMLGALGFSAAAAPGAITGDNVNMRRGPDRAAEVIMKLNRGQSVEILSTENEWVKIGLIREAYVHTDYLKDGKVAAKTNLRVGPGTNTGRLGVLPEARDCQELDRQGEWAHVRFREPVFEGYVSKSLVKEGAPSPGCTKPPASAGDTKPPASAGTKPAATPPPAQPGPQSVLADPAGDNWYGKLAIDPASKRDVTIPGMLYQLPAKEQEKLPGFRFVLLEVKNGKYVISCYVYTGPSKKYDAYANKQVTLVGDRYSVKGWSHPVLKLRKLTPRE